MTNACVVARRKESGRDGIEIGIGMTGTGGNDFSPSAASSLRCERR
jgi:hypothetical protein